MVFHCTWNIGREGANLMSNGSEFHMHRTTAENVFPHAFTNWASDGYGSAHKNIVVKRKWWCVWIQCVNIRSQVCGGKRKPKHACERRDGVLMPFLHWSLLKNYSLGLGNFSSEWLLVGIIWGQTTHHVKNVQKNFNRFMPHPSTI